METLNILLDGSLAAGDYIGFTFFTGHMSMLAASIFFIVERGTVNDKWKTSLLISALITFIAAVHYFYMRGVWLETHESPTQFRYIDWTLTVPLMCIEYFLILKPAGAKTGMLTRLIFGSVVMLVAGYIGEAVVPEQNVMWGIISTLGWALIIYEIYMGEASKLADASTNAEVQSGFKVMRWFTLVGWAIYPIGYMMLPGNLLSGFAGNIDLAYNIADAVNKIGFGLVVYSIAKGATAAEAK
jgi:bacteriorhodopsin